MTHLTDLVRNAQPPPLRVTLVHHDETFRGLVAELAAAQRWRFGVCGDFTDVLRSLGAPVPGKSDAPSAAALQSTAGPHVYLAPLRQPDACGLEWTRRLAALDGLTMFVLLAEQADAALGFSAIYSGASAFLLLPLNRAELLTAIQRAAAGRRFMSAAAHEASFDSLRCPEPAPSCTRLTPVEIKILWAMGQGRGEKGASQLLPMKLDTVHAHAKHIYLKLGVHSLPEALDKGFGRAGCPYTCLWRERKSGKKKNRPNVRSEMSTLRPAKGTL
jgi:DNA-binding NarL/FixJ family response regulator